MRLWAYDTGRKTCRTLTGTMPALTSVLKFGVQIMSPAFESQPERSVVVPKSKRFATPAGPPQGGPGEFSMSILLSAITMGIARAVGAI